MRILSSQLSPCWKRSNIFGVISQASWQILIVLQGTGSWNTHWRIWALFSSTWCLNSSSSPSSAMLQAYLRALDSLGWSQHSLPSPSSVPSALQSVRWGDFSFSWYNYFMYSALVHLEVIASRSKVLFTNYTWCTSFFDSLHEITRSYGTDIYRSCCATLLYDFEIALSWICNARLPMIRQFLHR